MKRKLVRENQIARIQYLKRRIRETEKSTADLEILKEVQKQLDSFNKQMKPVKLLLDSWHEKQKNRPVRRFRERERSEMVLKALKEVQNQLDSLIKSLMADKMLLAQFEAGADEVSYEENE
jgi:hypothetical protein